jgi:hypothetical protein
VRYGHYSGKRVNISSSKCGVRTVINLVWLLCSHHESLLTTFTFPFRRGTTSFSKVFSCVIKRRRSHWQERLRHVSVPFHRRCWTRLFDMTDRVRTFLYLLDSRIWTVFVFVFCVWPAVTHRMYCSLPRLILLIPLLVYSFHLQARATSDDTRDLSQRNVELWARNVRSI